MTPEDMKYAASIFTIIIMALVIVLTVVFIWVVSKDKEKEESGKKDADRYDKERD